MIYYICYKCLASFRALRMGFSTVPCYCFKCIWVLRQKCTSCYNSGKYKLLMAIVNLWCFSKQAKEKSLHFSIFLCSDEKSRKCLSVLSTLRVLSGKNIKKIQLLFKRSLLSTKIAIKSPFTHPGFVLILYVLFSFSGDKSRNPALTPLKWDHCDLCQVFFFKDPKLSQNGPFRQYSKYSGVYYMIRWKTKQYVLYYLMKILLSCMFTKLY